MADLVGKHAPLLPEPPLTIRRRMCQHGVDRRQVIVHDVPQSPRAAWPWYRIMNAGDVWIEASLWFDLIGGDRHRRRDSRAGGFRENAYPTVVMLVGAGR